MTLNAIPLVAALLAFLALSTPAVGGETVTLANGEWPPYHSRYLDGYGAGSRIYSEAFAAVGIAVEYEFMPWNRAFEMVRNGEVEGAVSWMKLPSREVHFWYSDPVLESQNVLFYERDSGLDWETVNDLKDKRIAMMMADSAYEKVHKAVQDGTGEIQIVREYESGMRMLVADRVDLFVCNFDVGLHILNRDHPEVSRITWHPVPIMTGESHLIISKKSPRGREMVEKFNLGLRKLKESGRYDRIFEEFVSTNQ